MFTNWIDPKIKRNSKTQIRLWISLLTDRQRHPITYNHYYTETLQKIRQERQEKELEMKIHDFLRTTDPVCTLNSHTIPALAKSLSTHSEKDMDSFACSELLDSMQAYYKVHSYTSCRLHSKLMA